MEIKALGTKAMEYIVIGALVGVIGYLVGNSDAIRMRSEIDALKRENAQVQRRIEKIETRLSGRFEFMGDAARIINYLCDKDELCQRRHDSLEVPQ